MREKLKTTTKENKETLQTSSIDKSILAVPSMVQRASGPIAAQVRTWNGLNARSAMSHFSPSGLDTPHLLTHRVTTTY